MVCSSCFAASSVLGGKNSKEKVGRFRAKRSLMCICIYWYQRVYNSATTPGNNAKCSRMDTGMARRTIAVMVGAALWAGCTAPVARAADPLKQTPFATNESMEVPGMMLAPGRYVLRLVDPGPERNVLEVFEVVQLWTGDESRLLSTLLTMPNYDQPTTDKTVFTFFDRGPKQAKALRLWFAPGRNYGQEFVYPKAQAVELAKSVGRAVLSMPPELPGDIGKLTNAVPQPNPAPPAAQPVAVTPSAPVMQPTSAAIPKIIPTAVAPAAAMPAPLQSRARAVQE